jgi:hypothetical protein
VKYLECLNLLSSLKAGKCQVANQKMNLLNSFEQMNQVNYFTGTSGDFHDYTEGPVMFQTPQGLFN